MFSAIALAAMMSLPAGLSAGWASYGSSEPDTHYDRDGGYAWLSAPGASADHVYFNAYIAEGNGGIVAPNSATLGGHTETVGPGTWRALLGVWADCNHDGFIGMADGAMLEYQASASAAAGLPIDPAICPVLPDSAANTGKIHNNGGWITELLAIVPGSAANLQRMNNVTDWRLVPDAGVRLWADFGQPRTPNAVVAPNDHCAQSTVLPVFGPGQAHHTGGMIQQAVCDESILVGPTPSDVYQLAVGEVPALGAVPDPATLWADGGLLDINEPGTDQSCKGDPSNPPPQPCPNGSNSFVSGEFDCGAKPLVDTDPATGTPLEGGPADGGNVIVFAPGTPSVNPQGTAPATVNETTEETTGDCNGTNDAGHDVYQYPLEPANGGAPSNVASTGKRSPNFEFTFDGIMQRGDCAPETAWQLATHRNGVATVNQDDPIPGDPAVVPALRCGEPNDKGLRPLSAEFQDNQWFAGTTYANTAPNPGPARIDRSSATPTVTPDAFPGTWIAAYAIVTASGVSTPGNVGSYGTEFCPNGIGTGAPSDYGWSCDPATWNLDPNTGTQNAAVAKVGDAYDLRDVDCYDTTLVSANKSPTGGSVGGRSLGPLNDPDDGCA
jgi:hypothetical protein